ncbi:MAG: haloacid dehalogenase, partial [Kocuria rhizophila]
MVLACLAAAGVDAGEALMIGDTSFDIQMAGNAGVRALGVAWGHHTPEALRAAGAVDVAPDMDALGRMIDAWLA